MDKTVALDEVDKFVEDPSGGVILTSGGGFVNIGVTTGVGITEVSTTEILTSSDLSAADVSSSGSRNLESKSLSFA